MSELQDIEDKFKFLRGAQIYCTASGKVTLRFLHTKMSQGLRYTLGKAEISGDSIAEVVNIAYCELKKP